MAAPAGSFLAQFSLAWAGGVCTWAMEEERTWEAQGSLRVSEGTDGDPAEDFWS